MDVAADGFDWDAGNLDKCQKHGLSVAEIEHVVNQAETFIIRDLKNSVLESRFIAIGRTPAGRFAFVAFTPRIRDGVSFSGPSALGTCTGRKLRAMKKKVPHFKTDEEAEAFLEQDLTDYLHAGNFKPVRFEIQPKEKSINLRLSEGLLETIRENAKREGVPYQRLIRHLLERGVTELNEQRAKTKKAG